VDEIEAWFLDYQATGDPAVRERIILAHLGLADRLAAASTTATGWPARIWSRRPGSAWSRPSTATMRFFQNLKQNRIGTDPDGW
jgi:hypothetical protein